MIQDQDPPIPDIVAAAMRLAPDVRAARDEAEQMRQTPPALAAEITKAGIYQMYLPRSMGGPETPPLTAFRVVEELSKADGSVGWCAMIATALSQSVGRLPVEVGRELAGTPADYRAAGSARTGGGAWEVPGGYRVKGRWNFASGIQNARWLYCTCIMMDGDTPRRTAAGAGAACPLGAEGVRDHPGHLVGDGHARHRQSGLHRGRCLCAGGAELPVGRASERDRRFV